MLQFIVLTTNIMSRHYLWFFVLSSCFQVVFKFGFGFHFDWETFPKKNKFSGKFCSGNANKNLETQTKSR
jgi:hypothetical protein